ncbi:hypothetical protein ACFVVM_16760 [Nocardia sp. NPDC058176]|uniref:hypothetical protein n=1 Tax=Nocardia sp. NPDC058176 TaxID=3346368 RepID=UPI0036DA8233
MTGHLIADPTATPAPAPTTGGWDSLSAALTAEAPPIADREDLIVTIAPGAAHGHPAVFMRHSAAIELDGTRLGIDPATAQPDRNSDRARYAAVWGAFVHECAHAKHSVWERPESADPAVVEAAMLLEESRIEAAQIRRRPDDRHWLRASATEIVLGDHGGAEAAAAIPPTPYAAAHTAALILGRVDGGVLDSAECAPTELVVESILGTDTLDKLRAIWREAHTVADDDAATMLELGRRWLDLVGPDPHADPVPGSMLGASIEATVANVGRAVAAEPVEPDPAEAADTARRDADESERRAVAQAYKVFSKGPSARRTSTRPPTPDEQSAARALARALDSAATRERAAVRATSALPPGRLRMRGALARQAQLAAGAIPTAEPFTRTIRKSTPLPPLRVGIACDVSASMKRFAAPVASAAWIIARAAELAMVPASTATLTFGRSVEPIVYPGTAPKQVTDFTCPDSFEVIDEAVEALDGALTLARPGATRLLVIISDGHYHGPHRDAAQQRLHAMRATGCAVLWLAASTGIATPLEGATVHKLEYPSRTAATIGRTAIAAVRAAA